MSEPEVHPIQIKRSGGRLQVPKAVTMAAYEVYCHLYGEQPAMITLGCRGGFEVGELIGFLYARSFPKEQWRNRVNEAWRGMQT